MNLTLDGVMQAPGRSDEDHRGGFQHGGWASVQVRIPRRRCGSGQRGRGTHGQHRGPAAGATHLPGLLRLLAPPDRQPFTEVLNKTQKYVASITLAEPLLWANSTLLEGDATQAVATLKQQAGKDLLTPTFRLRCEEGGTPWSDDTATYYAPDLRALAMEGTEIVEGPGRRFHYNNFNPLLVGLALKRAVGMPVAAYLERTLWQPLGMEADGSWSLTAAAAALRRWRAV